MSLIKKILDIIQILIAPVIVIIVIMFYVITPRNVDGVSMMPTFHDKDFILLYKLAYINTPPKRGDVVVFQHSAQEHYIKRVIGLPGETILLKDGRIYINGSLLDESAYLPSGIRTQQESFLIEGEPFTIPPNKFFCIGDNRSNSIDSREFGPVDLEYIEGRVVMIWFPLDRIKVINRVNYLKDQAYGYWRDYIASRYLR